MSTAEGASPSVHLVITRTKGEDMRWLDTLPELFAVIYNRQGLDDLLPKARPNLIVIREEGNPELSLLGPEDGMVRHILYNYDRLPDAVLFLQAWPFEHCGDARAVIRRAVQNVRRPRDADFLSNGAEDGLLPLTSLFHEYNLDEAQVGQAPDLIRSDPKLFSPDISVDAIASLAFNKTCKKLLRRRCNNTMWFGTGSQWAVSRERIVKSSREAYEHVLNVSTGSGGKMRETVLEALWPMFWGSPAWTPGIAHVRATKTSSPRAKSVLEAVNGYCAFSTDGGREKECEEDKGFCLYAQRTSTSTETKAVELRPVMQSAEIVKVCPLGYTFVDGDFPGFGYLGKEGHYYRETIHQCAHVCSTHETCKSFEWSSTTKACNLNLEANPTQVRFEDSVFCRSDNVPAHEVIEDKPENKVAAFLEGKMSAPRAREQRAREVETDLFLRIDEAWKRDSARAIERRLYCGGRHLNPPSLALVGKKWRLSSVGHPWYHVQVGDLSSCIVEPGARSGGFWNAARRGTADCSSKRDTLKFQTKPILTKGSFQLVSKGGSCLVRKESGFEFAACNTEDESQAWQLDLNKTGAYYERQELQTVESPEGGRLHFRCVSQLDNHEMGTPSMLEPSRLVHWQMVDATATAGPGHYYMVRSNGDGVQQYLSCPESHKQVEAVLSSTPYAWNVREGEGGAVVFESEAGMLQFQQRQGGLNCYRGVDAPSRQDVLFSIGLPNRVPLRL